MEHSDQTRYPLQDHTVVATNQLDEAREITARVLQSEHSLELLGHAAELDMRMHFFPVGGCDLSFFRYGGPLHLHVEQPFEWYMVHLPLSGPAPVEICEGNVHSMPGTGAVISAGPFMDMDFAPDTNRLVVRFQEDRLKRHLAAYLSRDINERILFKIPFPLNSPGARAFQNLTIELIQKIEQDVALLQSPIVAAQYEQLLMSILLQSQYHNYWDELQAGYSPAAPHYVKKALTYLHEHADQAIDMETLVGHTGVSARSLYAGFQRFKGETPMSYLKSERLRRARADLEAADPAEVTVTDIATKWSFFHLGRFSGDYRKAFGESPSVTLKSKAIRI